MASGSRWRKSRRQSFPSVAESLPFANEMFDFICLYWVLEHVARPEPILQEITRVLKPGGLLYSELPFMQQVHEGAYVGSIQCKHRAYFAAGVAEHVFREKFHSLGAGALG